MGRPTYGKTLLDFVSDGQIQWAPLGSRFLHFSLISFHVNFISFVESDADYVQMNFLSPSARKVHAVPLTPISGAWQNRLKQQFPQEEKRWLTVSSFWSIKFLICNRLFRCWELWNCVKCLCGSFDGGINSDCSDWAISSLSIGRHFPKSQKYEDDVPLKSKWIEIISSFFLDLTGNKNCGRLCRFSRLKWLIKKLAIF